MKAKGGIRNRGWPPGRSRVGKAGSLGDSKHEGEVLTGGWRKLSVDDFRDVD
jgi:hypothetical protein